MGSVWISVRERERRIAWSGFMAVVVAHVCSVV